MDILETQASVTYDKNKQEVLVRTKRRKIMGPFSAIGRLSTDKSGEDDIFDLLDQISKGAISLFRKFKSLRDENNNTLCYVLDQMSQSKRVLFGRYLRELRNKDIVRITLREMVAHNPQRPYVFSKSSYMINPNLIKCWDYEDSEALWGQCKR